MVNLLCCKLLMTHGAGSGRLASKQTNKQNNTGPVYRVKEIEFHHVLFTSPRCDGYLFCTLYNGHLLLCALGRVFRQ